MILSACLMYGIMWGMAGGLLGSYDGLTGKKKVIASETGIDTIAGVMPNAMMCMVE